MAQKVENIATRERHIYTNKNTEEGGWVGGCVRAYVRGQVDRRVKAVCKYRRQGED